MNGCAPSEGGSRVYMCRCGRVHVETGRMRITLSLEQFETLLRGGGFHAPREPEPRPASA